MSIAGAAFAAISVAGKLEADLRKRTIYNVLAKSISRSSYILGSYLGLLLAGAILISAIWSAMTLLVTLISGEFDFYHLFIALAYSLFEWSIVCADARRIPDIRSIFSR
jgi:ABC-type transport system involved in multi-copper enzyme maturation permease subunit